MSLTSVSTKLQYRFSVELSRVCGGGLVDASHYRIRLTLIDISKNEVKLVMEQFAQGCLKGEIDDSFTK